MKLINKNARFAVLLFFLLINAAVAREANVCSDCNNLKPENNDEPALITSLSSAKPWKAADCEIKNTKNGLGVEGNLPITNFKLTKDGCIDNRCFDINPKIEALLSQTINEGVSCLKKMADPQLSQAIDRAILGQPLSANDTAGIRNSPAARAAVQISNISALDPTFATFFNEKDQAWLRGKRNGDLIRSTQAEIIKDLKTPMPLRLACFPTGSDFSLTRQAGDIILVESIKVTASFANGAKGGLPNSPLHPSIILDPIGFKMQSRNDESVKSLLFHELFHLLGYMHEDGMKVEGLKQPLPYFSACQLCCFPNGLKNEQITNPKTKAKCSNKGPGSLLQTACDVCSGKISQTEFEKGRKSYRDDSSYCYTISNPL